VRNKVIVAVARSSALAQACRVGAGGVELAEQGQRLAGVGVLDQRELVEVLAAQDGLDPGGFGVDAALAAGAEQRGAQLGLGQLRRRTRGQRRSQDSARFGAQQAVALVGEPARIPG
jgi:hypothetical protein